MDNDTIFSQMCCINQILKFPYQLPVFGWWSLKYFYKSDLNIYINNSPQMWRFLPAFLSFFIF